MKPLRVFLAALAMQWISSCASFVNFKDSWPEPSRPYDGTRENLEGLRANEPFHDVPYFYFVIHAIDLPFCLVADTVLLPVQGILWLGQRAGDS